MARGRQSIPWGRRVQPENLGPQESQFEEQVRYLRLGADELVNSVPLRYWAMKHADDRYVPEELLHAWGIDVEWNWDRT
jgi:hypothetical protein